MPLHPTHPFYKLFNPDAPEMSAEEKAKLKSATYECGCHCGYIKYAVTLSPPLPEYEVLNCNCSMCRSAGYLLVYPERKNVQWHGESESRCAVYRFNTKQKDQLFCPKCGTSLMIDFKNWGRTFDGYGVSVRTFYGIDLDTLKYEKGKGLEYGPPARDLSGTQWEIDEKERLENEKAEKKSHPSPASRSSGPNQEQTDT